MPKYEYIIFLIWMAGTIIFSVIMRSIYGYVFSWSFSFPLVLGVSLILCFISIGLFHIATNSRGKTIRVNTEDASRINEEIKKTVCPSCGLSVKSKDEFCPHCGAEL